MANLTFSEALVASLNAQRSRLVGQRPLCDVILRSGGIATQAHSAVLVSASKFCEKLLNDRKSHQVRHECFKRCYVKPCDFYASKVFHVDLISLRCDFVVFVDCKNDFSMVLKGQAECQIRNSNAMDGKCDWFFSLLVAQKSN